jgi:hypothetical protein
MFLIYEEMDSFNGKAPPAPRKDLCKFLHLKWQPFVKCFHVITVNPTAQVYLAQDLHNTVHGGLLQPGVGPFLQAIHSLGFHHVYNTLSVPTHRNKFIQIFNGRVAELLPSFRKVDFNMTTCRVNPSVVGQCWNSQYTWGNASMDFKRTNPDDMVSRPSIKSANVSDGILCQFIVLSDLLLEIDKDKEFNCGFMAGNVHQIHHAWRLMDEDPLIHDSDKERNVLESVSGICNIYSKASTSDIWQVKSGSSRSANGTSHEHVTC